MSKFIDRVPRIAPDVEAVIKELHRVHADYAEGMGAKINTVRGIRNIWGVGLKEAVQLYDVVIRGKDINETALVELLG